jgi:hypothetical protein
VEGRPCGAARPVDESPSTFGWADQQCDRPAVTSPLGPLDLSTVKLADDTVAEDYATRLPDTRAEAPLDLARVDAFAEAVTSRDSPRVLDAPALVPTPGKGGFLVAA